MGFLSVGMSRLNRNGFGDLAVSVGITKKENYFENLTDNLGEFYLHAVCLSEFNEKTVEVSKWKE